MMLAQHRPGLGRQRGLAARRRRHAVLRVPAALRLGLQRLLPAADDRALAADPARHQPGIAQPHRRGRMARPAWTACSALSSALLTIFFGAALANVLRGVPLQATATSFFRSGRTGSPASHPGILDWYTVIGGVVALVALTLHGALWLSLKTSGDLEPEGAPPGVSPLWLQLVRSPSSASEPPSPSAQKASTTTSITRSRSLFPWA